MRLPWTCDGSGQSCSGSGGSCRALDLWLALQRVERILHRLVGRELAHADRVRLVHGNSKRHLLLLEAEDIKLETGSGDFGALQFDDATNAMLGVYDVIADIEIE